MLLLVCLVAAIDTRTVLQADDDSGLRLGTGSRADQPEWAWEQVEDNTKRSMDARGEKSKTQRICEYVVHPIHSGPPFWSKRLCVGVAETEEHVD